MRRAEEDTPPYWPQSTTIQINRARRHSSSAPLINPALLIILVPIITILLIFFILPLFLSFASQIFRPVNTNNAVKKGWDSLNILLVLFAILCGVFARKSGDESTFTSADRSSRISDSPIVVEKIQQQQWLDEFSDDSRQLKITPETTDLNMLRRNGSSYPDLRRESPWGNSGDDRFRFFDDFELTKHRTQGTVRSAHRRRYSMEDDSEIKVIPVDKFQIRSTSTNPARSISPEPLASTHPPPLLPMNRTRRTIYRNMSRGKEKTEVRRTRSPPDSSPAHPPMPPQKTVEAEEVYVKIERKKSNATKEIKSVLASIYNQRKLKKKPKTKIIIDDSLDSPPSSVNPSSRQQPPPAPPPPPPPPPPSVFYNLFKKGSKSKRVHSDPPRIVPPPPPPPPSFQPSTQSWKRQNEIPPPSPSIQQYPPIPPRYRNSIAATRPPLPTRIRSSYKRDETVNSGSQSPLIPMPPPPPPFRMTEMKFSVRGDYVSIRSTHSSRCSSPEREAVDLSSDRKAEENNGDDVIGPSVSCPSPDVNTKADTFIARLRDEWKLEKINSLKGKQKLGHNLGP